MELGPGNLLAVSKYLKNWHCFTYNNSLAYSWIQYEKYSFVKYPVTHFDPPSKEEIATVFKETKTRLLSYAELCTPAEENAHWYACKHISEKNITGSYMRNLKTARKHLTVKMVPLKEFYQEGFTPFAQLRQRKGLDDGTMEDFIKRFKTKNGETLHTIIGAYHNEKLVSYIPFLMFEDFVEIEGPYTANDALKYCANELLIFTALDYCLNQQKIPVVSYGYSSIQNESKDFKLHEFKVKVGFEAVPIKRHFLFNPRTRIFINPVTKSILRTAGILFPRNGAIRKINGVFEYTK